MNKLLLLILVGGCGSPFGGPMLNRRGSCDMPTDGIVSLAWTIRGAAPSSQSCQGIDHLSVEIDGGLCGATIAPVPCTLDRWRYDNLPEGGVTATVAALDSSGRTVAVGSVGANLTASVPASPVKLDLQ